MSRKVVEDLTFTFLLSYYKFVIHFVKFFYSNFYSNGFYLFIQKFYLLIFKNL